MSKNHFASLGSRFYEILEKLDEINLRIDRMESSFKGLTPTTNQISDQDKKK